MALEFGVFQGSSMISAYRCWKSVRRGPDLPRAFYGFDSFEGVKIHLEEDRHPTWVDRQRVLRAPDGIHTLSTVVSSSRPNRYLIDPSCERVFLSILGKVI